MTDLFINLAGSTEQFEKAITAIEELRIAFENLSKAAEKLKPIPKDRRRFLKRNRKRPFSPFHKKNPYMAYCSKDGTWTMPRKASTKWIKWAQKQPPMVIGVSLIQEAISAIDSFIATERTKLDFIKRKL
ncbi:MAG TPA: hypothetical protein VEA37_12210 [Flavobacterium sp.]|nr:hypothetical protein [Flavobacterium sp.]